MLCPYYVAESTHPLSFFFFNPNFSRNLYPLNCFTLGKRTRGERGSSCVWNTGDAGQIRFCRVLRDENYGYRRWCNLNIVVMYSHHVQQIGIRPCMTINNACGQVPEKLVSRGLSRPVATPLLFSTQRLNQVLIHGPPSFPPFSATVSHLHRQCRVGPKPYQVT